MLSITPHLTGGLSGRASAPSLALSSDPSLRPQLTFPQLGGGVVLCSYMGRYQSLQFQGCTYSSKSATTGSTEKTEEWRARFAKWKAVQGSRGRGQHVLITLRNAWLAPGLGGMYGLSVVQAQQRGTLWVSADLGGLGQRLVAAGSDLVMQSVGGLVRTWGLFGGGEERGELEPTSAGRGRLAGGDAEGHIAGSSDHGSMSTITAAEEERLTEAARRNGTSQRPPVKDTEAAALREHVSALETALESARIQLALSGMRDLSSRCYQLSKELENSKKEVGGLKAALADSQQQMGGMATALEASQQEMGELRTALRGSQQPVGELKAALEASQQQVGELKADLEASKQEMGELRTALGGSQQPVGELKAALEASQQQVGELKSALEASQQEMEELRTALRASQQPVGDLKAALEASQQQIGELKAALEGSQQEIRELEAALAESEEEEESLEGQLADAKKRARVAKQYADTLENDLTEVKAEMLAKEVRRMSETAKAQLQAEELAELKRQLAQRERLIKEAEGATDGLLRVKKVSLMVKELEDLGKGGAMETKAAAVRSELAELLADLVRIERLRIDYVEVVKMPHGQSMAK